MGDAVGGEVFELGDGAPREGQSQDGFRHADGLEAELAAETEGAVAEQGQADDGAVEDVRGIDVGHDAAAGLVVVYHGGVDEVGRDDAELLQLGDDQPPQPGRDGVHLPLRVEKLIAQALLDELRPVRVALAEEISASR